MQAERWRQVKHVFQAAVELPTAKRAAYLADACADDPSLLIEVKSLNAEATAWELRIEDRGLRIEDRGLPHHSASYSSIFDHRSSIIDPR